MLETERAPVGSREFSLCTGCWSQHRRKGKEEEEEEVKEDGGGAEECPQERMASLEVLSRHMRKTNNTPYAAHTKPQGQDGSTF